MSDPRTTDYQLKCHLNTRQPDRERMCLAILGIESGFTKIEPRRPEGGPDGGRDIQCNFDGFKCFGAVGFKNSANDSSEQRREIRSKFTEDLDSALDADPELKAFVFFTNLDLTPGELEDLKKLARLKGIDRIEIYWRERIRLLLDSPEGYAIRHTFLDISLSDAEQKVFFSKFGKELQTLISGRMESVEQRIEEIQFVNWMRGAVQEINVRVKLHEIYQIEGADHQPFRFALRLTQVRTHGEGEILFGCHSEIHQNQHRADFGVKNFMYSDCAALPMQRKKHIRLAQSVRVGEQPFEDVNLGCRFTNLPGTSLGSGLAIRELIRFCPMFYCDTFWMPRVNRVEVWFDEYLVHEFKLNQNSDGGGTKIPFWPEDTGEIKDRQVTEYWGWGWHDTVCKRKRIGER